MHWLVLVIVALHQAFVYQRFRKIDPLSVFSLVDVAVVFILFVGTLLSPLAYDLMQTDVGFILVLLVGQVSLYAGLHIIPVVREPGSGWRGFKAPSAVWLYLASAIYIATCFTIASAYASLLDVSVLEWTFGARMSAYAISKTTGAGMILNYVMTVFQVGLLIMLMSLAKERRWLGAALMYVVLFVGVYLMFTTRLQLLVIVALPAFFFHYYVRRLTVSMMAGIGIGIVLLASLLNMARGGGISYVLADLTTEKFVQFSSLETSTYFVEPTAILYTKLSSGEVKYEYGLNYSLMWLTFIPRALWPDKPLTAFENRMTVELFGTQFDEANFTNIWTFTAWGEGFAQYGVLGVALNLFLYGLVIGWPGATALAGRTCSLSGRTFRSCRWCI